MAKGLWRRVLVETGIESWGVLYMQVLVVTAVAIATLGAATAQASVGIDTWWGNPEAFGQIKGGLFSSQPRGVAVNGSSGDVYVADAGNNRIERFSGSGSFIEAWGKNVDATGGSGGYEICAAGEPDHCQAGATGTLGGELSGPGGLAIDQATGNLYAIDTSNRRVQEYSATGTFIRAFGKDVVQTGKAGNNAATSAQQTLSVDAGGGQFKLSFQGKTTPDLPFNASAAEVQTALQALTSIGTGNATVSGGPGAVGGGTPYVITFAGALKESPQPLIGTTPGTTPLSGGAASASVVNTTTGSTGFEVCEAAADCQAGTAGTQAGAFGAFGGVIEGAVGSGLTVVPAGAPNAGDVLVGDAGNVRVQEFSSSGQFVRAFGWDVVTSGPGNKDFSGGPDQANELQSITVRATSGQFKLSFGAGGLGVAETTSLPFNASAAEVQGALNGVTNISGGGGSVTVSGGPGDATGATPYKVSFNGGPLAGKDVAQIAATSVGLGGGVPSSSATATTLLPGNSGFEVCNVADTCKGGFVGSGVGAGQFAAATPTRIAEDKSGRIYTVEPTSNFRVQRFTLPGNVVTPQGEFAAAALHGTSSKPGSKTEPKDNTTEVAVDDAGNVYAIKAFPIGTGTPAVQTRPGSTIQWQQRLLKLDPVSGAVIWVAGANAGFVNGAAFDNAAGLAAAPAGTPLYATTAAGSGDVRARVFRFNEISGLGASGIKADEVKASTARLRATITPAAIPLGSAYRFEYSADEITWNPVPVPDAQIGNGSAGGVSSSCPLPQAASCEVSREISGLTPNTTYKLRLVLYSIFDQGKAQTLAGEDFRSEPAPPVAKTGAAHWSSPAATAPSLSLGGTVNPGHDRTTYRFEYVDDATFAADKLSGDGFQHATAVPAAGAEAGHGLGDVSVHEIITGLDPGLTYHFRLIATNSVGTKAGVERSVAPPVTSDRFYEWVSAGDSWGSGIAAASERAVADSGNRASFAAQAFGKPRSVPGLGTPFVSERGPGGWSVANMTPDPARATRSLAVQASASADLGALLWPESSIDERERSEVQFGRAGIDGSLVPASPLLVPLQRSGHGLYGVAGTATDMGTIVFGFEGLGSVRLTAVETLPAEGRSNLYEITGAGSPSAALRVVNRADGAGGAVLGGACGARLGDSTQGLAMTTHAVSDDGSVIYFNARPSAPSGSACTEAGNPKRIFKRIEGKTTVEVSKPQCSPACAGPDGDDGYRGASADGQVVFFTTVRRLLNSDTDSTSDLYAYDADPPAGQPTLVQVSAGGVAPGHPTPGAGAKVLGVLDNSADGSRVYFVAEAALTGANLQGKAPTGGAKNLYVYERDGANPTGRIAFVGGLAAGVGKSGDEFEWDPQGDNLQKQSAALPVGGSGDGHIFILVSAAKLTAEDSDSSKDVYRYEDGAGTPAALLRCVSCAGSGASEAQVAAHFISRSPGNYAQETRIESEDGTVVFTTQEALLSEDQNSTWDTYTWRNGTLALISGGTEGFGTAPQAMISPDGKNVFFVTQAALVGTDTNNAPDLYDARIGGGFPEQARGLVCEGELSCHGPEPAPQPTPAALGSETASGGNVTPPPACKKGFVRKHGKCVKKHSKHNKHQHKKAKHHKRAGLERGADR
jgi:hypothetical protein